MAIKNYTDLEVWQLGIELAKEAYHLADRLPKTEIFGLVSQIRRSAVSIPSNIAEGHRRQYPKEFVQFLYQALGSLAELETQIFLTGEIHHIKASDGMLNMTGILGRKLRRLIQALVNPKPQ
ncbi:MAG: four helix bundle protein [Elusimicrobia bacterium]|nr:four helix bundle protein [Elusimicrobiota bacterium]